MKKIGFIDYYLNEWHADNYPAWIEAVSDGKYKVCYCWGEIDCPHKGGMTNKEWAEKQGIELCSCEEEVIEKSDVLVVLAPDNPETHERLARRSLMSGKPTYVDKTFAPDFETAKRIFEIAEKHSTPCISTSALRFADEYKEIDVGKVTGIASIGSGKYEIYCIHQIEPMVMLLGTDVEYVEAVSVGGIDTFIVSYKSGVVFTATCINPGSPFQMSVNLNDNTSKMLTVESDVFANMIKTLIEFFETGKELIPHAETLAVIHIRDAFKKAHENPSEKIYLNS